MNFNAFDFICLIYFKGKGKGRYQSVTLVTSEDDFNPVWMLKYLIFSFKFFQNSANNLSGRSKVSGNLMVSKIEKWGI